MQRAEQLETAPPVVCLANSVSRNAPKVNREQGSSGQLGLERDGGRLDDRGVADGGLDLFARHARLSQHVLMGVDAHAAAIDGRDGQRPELEIGLVDPGLPMTFMRSFAGMVL